jgi:hypothetical protein
MTTTALPDSDVRRAVGQLLGRPVQDLQHRSGPIDDHLRFHSVTLGLLRVSGTADGEPFSLVVKQTRLGHDADPGALWVSGAEDEHRAYWKREWLAYESGLLAGLPGRLRAPRLLLATEPAEHEAWLWLEDVAGLPGERWQPQHYARAAYDLGTTQGAYAASRAPLPDHRWLSRGWLAGWVRTTERWWGQVGDDSLWDDPRLARLAALRPAALEVWGRRDRLLAVISEAPQTLVHLDLWPANLIAGAGGPGARTAAVDWSSVGIGRLAQDLDQLTLDPVWMQVRPEGDLDLLERAVLPAYGAGLRVAGATVTDTDVRRWYAATAGLRYVSVLATQPDLVHDPARAAATEQRWGRPLEAILADRARVIRRAVELGREALDASG